MTKLFVNVVLTTPLVGAYLMFALGIVFIHRASRVLNLAHGAMAMVPAYVAYSVAPHAGVFVALGVAVATGAGLGAVVERGVVWRLRRYGATSQTVGTVAVLGILISAASRIWGTTPLEAPQVFPKHVWRVGNAQLQLGSVGLFVVALVIAAGVVVLLRFTTLGLALRASADNPRAARLMGLDPERVATLGWIIAGGLAALGGVLLAATTNLHPYTLSLEVLPAFVAALVGGLESIEGAVAGAVVVGFVIGITPTIPKAGSYVGVQQAVLTVVALVVMGLRGERLAAGEFREGL